MIRNSICFRFLRCRHVIGVRRISESENEKQLNPFRKVIRHRGLVFDYWDRVANRICLSVLGNGSAGEPPSLAMFTDYKSYLFNCGEGIGRVFREHDLNLFDVSHIFITHKDWKKMSGLPDMYLNLQNVKQKRLSLHGPPHVEDFFGVTVSYEKHLKIIKKPVENKVYKDSTMEVEYVPIFASYSVTSQLRSATRYSNHKHQGSRSGISFFPEGSDMAVCYICKCVPKPRKLSWERCVELNVPIGPLLLELKNGNDVTLPSGKKVLAEDVLDPAGSSMVFLVVDCPSEHFLNSFVTEEKFKPYQMPTPEVPVAVVHFTPPDIFDSYQYQKWISKFSPETLHLVLNSANLIPSRIAAQRLQNMLNLLHPRIFKCLPRHSYNVDPPTMENIIHAEGGLVLHLRPSMYLDRDNIAVGDPKSDVQHAEKVPGFSESLSHLHSHLQQHELKKNVSGSIYPEVIFLGTGSACSSAYRNCSCILVNASANQSVVFDCGDGAYQQFVQYFGDNEVKNILKRISCIFISHQHTDHYMGLFELIKMRKEAFYLSRQSYVPLVVTIPRILNKVFDNFENMFGPVRSDVRIFRNSVLNEHQGNVNLKKYMGNLKLRTVPVKHTDDSHGVVLSDGSGWKIVYSGDCSPSQNLIDAGKDCTLLIHEATLEDEMEQEALLRHHSTISQALEVSQQMNARHTIVTHFCSFYVEIPLIRDSHEDYNVGIAFDHMRVRLCDLPHLPLFIPVLKTLFSGRLDEHQVEARSNEGFEILALKSLKS